MLGDQVVDYLKYHNIEARLREVIRSKSVADTLVEEAQRLEADLLIMGGYGSSRLAEWLLGGTTRTLLRKCPVPLLIAH